ncbi:hypothetical protein F0U62_41255 [Cystobacter fuscus]|uniref:hypothetical protein n=1 Tax=Cystobacter fuscus TaxID=43 RepID=UPI002B2D1F2E|nr:hypothetical protein F0U62_41255 [Cystobacter fuscus]
MSKHLADPVSPALETADQSQLDADFELLRTQAAADLLSLPSRDASAEELLSVGDMLVRDGFNSGAICTVELPGSARNAHVRGVFERLMHVLLDAVASAGGSAFSSGGSVTTLTSTLFPQELVVGASEPVVLRVQCPSEAPTHFILINVHEHGGNTIFRVEGALLDEAHPVVTVPYSAPEISGTFTTLVAGFHQLAPPDDTLLSAPVESWPDLGLRHLCGYRLTVE